MQDVDARPAAWTWVRTMCGVDGGPGDRRRLRAWAMLTAVAYLASAWVITSTGIDGPPALVVAAAPAVPMGGIVVAYLRYLRTIDEFLRTVEVEGLAIGFGLGVVVLLTWGLLEGTGVPALQTTSSAAVMLVSWVLGQVIARLRYR